MKRDWVPAYTIRKASLTNDRLRHSLELAEESISVDPIHRYQRLELDGLVFDANEVGLIVIYRVAPDGTIIFVTFRDLWNR